MNIKWLGCSCATSYNVNAGPASISQEQLPELMASKSGAEFVEQLRFTIVKSEAPAPGIEPGSQE